MPMPKLISKSLALRIHQRQIERFGGSQGVRDNGLLESALAQPQSTFSGQLLHPTLHEQAAAYLYHLAKNHPFVDGSKRTAYAVTETFLRLNGYTLTLDDEQAFQLVLDVAQSQLEKDALARQLEQWIVPK
ncbi:MAG: type II toxin-antitoxin system death-on-curing family toxin [Cyanobacteria bacterium Co-bin13]|nr:type II toxin-antitoxin system death-on-curing family toxin [Cyanobacteria bacterium Co-bin13]